MYWYQSEELLLQCFLRIFLKHPAPLIPLPSSLSHDCLGIILDLGDFPLLIFLVFGLSSNLRRCPANNLQSDRLAGRNAMTSKELSVALVAVSGKILSQHLKARRGHEG